MNGLASNSYIDFVHIMGTAYTPLCVCVCGWGSDDWPRFKACLDSAHVGVG